MSTRRDVSRVLLAACVYVFGAGRPDWGRGMLSELAVIDERRERRRFALGCARSLALTLPPPGSGRAVTVGVSAAGVASLGVVAAALLRYPGVVSGPGTWLAVGAFTAVVVAYVVVAARLGAAPLERRLLSTAVVAGAVIAGSWLAVGAGAAPALLLVCPLVGVTLGWSATARSGSTRAGLRCVGVTGILAGFTVFLLWAGGAVVAAGRPYDPGLLRDFGTSGAPDLATYAVNESLGTGMMLLLLVPLVSAATGFLGAAAAGLTPTAGTPPTRLR
jgi:hypothetical protein